MKNIFFVFVLFCQVTYSQTVRVPLTVLLNSYTQSQENTLAATLIGIDNKMQIWNSTTASIRIWDGSVFSDVPTVPPTGLPIATSTNRGTVPSTGTPSGKYLKDDMTWANTPQGDMVLSTSQIVSGAKIFNDTKFLLRNVANTFNGSFVNTNTADRIYTLKDAAGTLAFTSDITGTNSGTNTGDNATNSQYSGLVSNATHTGDVTGATALTIKTSVTLVTPIIGVATGTSLAVTGAITSSGAGIGYTTGAGGTTTQATARTTGVTLSKLSGTITMVSAAVAAAASSTFTWTNTFIAATDMVVMQHNSTTNACSWVCEVICGAGTATVVVKNISAASITEATPLKFIVIKAATN